MTDKSKTNGPTGISNLFAIAFIIAGSILLTRLQNLEVEFQEECKTNGTNAQNGTKTEARDEGLENFCTHVDTWKLLAILGIVIPGVLHLVFGFITLGCTQTNEDSKRYMVCSGLWGLFTFVATGTNVTIFYMLLSSGAHKTDIGDGGMSTAALWYICLAGVGVVFLAIAMGILVCVCLCTCGGLCVKEGGKYGRPGGKDAEKGDDDDI